MKKVNNVARLFVTLLVTCVMILGLIPVPALAEMRDVVDTAEVAKKDFSEGEQLTTQEMSNGTPADSPKEKSGDAVGKLGEENAVPLTESNAVSESPEPAEASSELLGRAATEVREACSARVDLGEAEEQARLVATLFDACVAITARNEGTSSDANGTPDLYRQLTGMTDDAQAPAFAALREMLAKDVTDKGVADTFVRMLHELGVEHLEVEGANGARWAMVRVGDAWYHVDPVAAAKAVATGDEADARVSLRLWLLVSSETIRTADPTRDPWNDVSGAEVPTADHGYRWEPEATAPTNEVAPDSELEHEEASVENPADTSDRPQTSEPKESPAAPIVEEPAAVEGPQEAEAGKGGEESVEKMNAATLREKLRSQNGTSIPEMGTQAFGESPILSTQSDEGTRERFVEVVREQEDGTGYGTYISSWYDWCAAFVQRCADWSGVSDDVIPRGYNYVTTFRDKLLEHGGQWLPYWENPQPGDLIFYNNLNYSDLEGDQASGDDLNHVGIVAWTDDDGYTTKEGNGGGGTGVVNSKRHWYGRNYTGWSGITYIVGFVRPNWPQSDPGPTVPDWGKFGGDANLPTGYYTIRPMLDTKKYLEIGGGGTSDGDNVQIWTHGWPGECEHIKWHLNRLEDGSYGVDTFAGKVLDVSGGSQDDGANAQQWSWTGANQQHWYIHNCGNGTYALEAKHSGKFLDLSGGSTGDGSNVQQWSWYSNDNDSQKWVITPCELYGGKRDVDDGWWYIRSAADPNYTLDISSAEMGDGGNLQLWSWNRVPQQQFRFIKSDNDETYRIEARHSGRVLDVASGSRFQGANIGQWSYGGVDQQRWWVQDVGDWKMAFQSKNSGLYIDIAGGVCQNGQNVQQWSKGEGDAAKWWYLTPAHEGTVASIPDGTYEIVTSIDNASVVAATPSEDDDYAAMASSNGSLRQRFSLTNSSDGSVRVKNLGNDSYLDVGGASLARGTLNNFWSDTDEPQQHWYVEDAGSGTYSFRNKWTNLYLDVSGGDASEGNRLCMFTSTGNQNQKFKLRHLTLNDATIDAIATQAYTGTAVTPNPTVRFAGRVLTEGTDYTVSYASNVAAGTATVTVTGANGFEGSKSASFGIASVDLAGATISAISDQPYTGSAVKPEPTVTLGGKTLVKDTDYTLSWSNNTNVGTATVTATGKGSYTGSKSTTFKIVAATSAPAVFVSPDRYTYDGTKKSPAVTVTAGGKTLTKGTDYDLSYTGDFTNVGTHTVTANLKGNYSGSAQANVQIAAADLSVATISSISDQTYTGSAIKPEPSVTLNGRTLVKNTDYTFTWTNNTNVGTATVTVTGKGNYTGTKSSTFSIVSKSITPTVTLSKTSFTYNGSVQRPTVTVKDGPTTLAESQYGVSWPAGCTNVGSYSVRVTLKGNYAGTATKSFSIVAADLSSAAIPDMAGQTYTGSEIQAKPTVTHGDGTLAEGADYTLSWDNNTNVGTATVTATGKGNYTGSKSATFSIERAKIAVPTGANPTYNGKVQTGVPEGYGYSVTGTAKAISAGSYSATVTLDDNHMWADGTTQAKTVDWSIARRGVTVRANNVSKSVGSADPQLTASVLGTVASETIAYGIDRERGDAVGTYEIVVTGDAVQGNYEVAFVGATFTISRGILDNATIGGLPDEVDYSGEAQTPAPTVRLDGRVLRSGTDYSVVYYDNVGPGTASIVIMGEGDYSGAVGASFKIKPADIANASVSDIPDQVYTGKGIEPKPTVKAGAMTLEEGTDYALSYENNVNLGTARVTVTGKGNFTGAKSVDFKIRPAKPFSDVAANAWYAGVVYRAVGLGLLSGYGNGNFGPADKVIRGQVAVILWNMAGSPEVGSGAKTFPDVGEKDYYYNAVRWASSKGVVSGYGNGMFGPKDNVTREQLAVMLANFARNVRGRAVTGSAGDFASMADRGKVSGWAVSAVGWCFKNQILSGSDGNVNPGGYASRAEAAKMVVGLYDLLG